MFPFAFTYLQKTLSFKKAILSRMIPLVIRLITLSIGITSRILTVGVPSPIENDLYVLGTHKPIDAETLKRII